MITEPIRCVIVLPPEGQRRARSRAFLKTSKKTGRKVAVSSTYKGDEQRTAEEKLLSLLYEHRPPAPEPGPILLGIRAYLPLPSSLSKKKRALALAGELRPTVKPDLDNLIKHLKDVAKGVFWIDDKQVVGYLPGTGKYYGEPARWEITVTTPALATRRDLGEDDHHEEEETAAQAHSRYQQGRTETHQKPAQARPGGPGAPTSAPSPPLFIFTQ